MIRRIGATFSNPQVEILSITVVVALYLTYLAGRFSLYRIVPSWLSLGLAGELRYWMIGALIVLAFVAHLKFSRRFTSDWLPLMRWLLLVETLLAFVAVSIVWSPSPTTSFVGFTNVISLGILLAVSPFALLWNPGRSIHVVLQLIFWTGVVYFAAGASGIWRDGLRWSAFEGGPNVFVRVLAAGAIAAVYVWRHSGNWSPLIALPLLTVGMISSGSRGGLVSAMVGYPIASWVLRRDLKFFLIAIGTTVAGVMIANPLTVALQQTRLAVIAILMSLSTLGLAVAPPQTDVPVSSPTSSATTPPMSAQPEPSPLSDMWWQRFVVLTLEQRYFADRDRLYAEAIGVFVDHPLVGVGIDGFRHINTFGEPYPHNLFLLIAAETGIVGLLLFVLTLPALLLRRRRPLNLEHKAALCLGLYFLAASMFSGGWYDARFMWFGFLLYMAPANDATDRVDRSSDRA